MLRRLWFVSFLFLFASLANAAATITPKVPSKVDSCYQISSAEELYGFGAIVNGNVTGIEKDSAACGELTNDIVVNENVLDENGNLNVADTASFVQWIPITKFSGRFNGNSHTISGIYIYTNEPRYIGFFGIIHSREDGGTVDIRNLGIIGSFFHAGDYVGALVGFMESGAVVNIENCYNHSRVESNGFAIGGLVGYSLSEVRFKTVHNLGPVTGNRFAGGIVGYLNGQNVKIIDVYNMGTITSWAKDPDDAYYMGGLVGYLNVTRDLLIENSFNMGPVSGGYGIGGIAGLIRGQKALVKTVFNGGTIKSFDGYEAFAHIGGLAGFAAGNLTFQNSYNVGSVSGYKGVGGIIGLNYSEYLSMTNVYNAGTLMMMDSDVSYLDPIMWNPSKETEVHFENTFYLDANYESAEYGNPMTSEQMEDGSIAYLMHYSFFDSVDATVWGQDVGNDMHPNFSGVVTDVSLSSLRTLIFHTYEGDTTALPEKYLPGFEFKLPVVAKEGDVFGGWFDNAEFRGNAVEVIPDTAQGTQEFWAKFIGIRQVTFETDGGTIDSGLIESYVEGEGAVLPKKVSRSGYIFNGWYEEDDFSGNRVFEIGTDALGEKVFYAKWFKKEKPEKDESGCYVISNAEELYGFAAIVNGTDGYKKETYACASLANNIVVNENVLNEDGLLNEGATQYFMEWDPIVDFEGTFDGNMYTISGLYIRTDEWETSPLWGFGLFSSISGGTLEDPVIIASLGIVDSYFEAPYNVGGLVGYVNYGNISKDKLYTAIINCYSTSTLVAEDDAGGIFGAIDNHNVIIIKNSYNSGKIVAKEYGLGGIVGYKERLSDAYIVNSFNVGELSLLGQDYGRSLVGANHDNAFAVNSYYLQSSVGSIDVGIGATPEQFADGSVALALHGGESGSIWGQNVGVDPLPNYSGKVKNSTAIQYNVSFYTYPGDKVSYYDSYVAGLLKPLPDTVVRNGYSFDGWYGDSSYSGSSVDSILSTDKGNLEFYAKMTPILYEIETYASPSAWGKVVGLSETGIYHYGDTIFLEAIPAPGYEFECWRDDVDNTNPKRTYVVSETESVVAYFKLGMLSSSSQSSSSSAKSSSSSAKSSSSMEKSSSSVKAASSSSRAKSSSAGAESSSSKKFLPIEFHILCNGKECSDALPSESVAPQFHVIGSTREIWVMDAHIGKPYALFDMQGRLLRSGYVFLSDFTIPVNRPGNYLVRIGNQLRAVSVR